jgi:hypothetical protein
MENIIENNAQIIIVLEVVDIDISIVLKNIKVLIKSPAL